MLYKYQAVAARSLFFVNVDRISAVETGRVMDPLMWVVSAHRGMRQNSEAYILCPVDIAVEYAEQPKLHRTTSSWYIVNSIIHPSHLPSWAGPVIARHRLKQLSVALAAQVSSNPPSKQTPVHHFFSSLSLPTTTSLPVHVHASFVLADDRRSIRWDGNGSLNEDSKFNHWLMTSQLPPLYLYLVELFAKKHPDSPCPWPASTVQHPDVLSAAIEDVFYSQDCLASTSRRLFRGITKELLAPASAIVREPGGPACIKDLLTELRPEELVELPYRVRSKVLKIGIKKMDKQFVCSLIKRERHRFIAAYTTTSGVSRIGTILHYLLDNSNSSDPVAPDDDLIGLPLLPLADGTLSNLPAPSNDPSAKVYAGLWTTNHRPWPVFPAHRFLHPDLHSGWRLPQKFNVASFDSAAAVRLMREKPGIREAPVCTVPTADRAWITSFWALFDTLPGMFNIEDFKTFALIPTANSTTFISLNRADTAISSPKFPSELWLAEPLQDLGLIVTQPNGSSLQLPESVRSRLAPTAFTFNKLLIALDGVQTDVLNMNFRMLSTDIQARLANWLRHAVTMGSFTKKKKGVNTKYPLSILRHLPIWPSYQGAGSASLHALTESNVFILPQQLPSAEKIIGFLKSDAFFVEHSQAIGRLLDNPSMSPSQFASCLNFPPLLTASELTNQFIPFFKAVISLVRSAPHQFSIHMPVPRSDLTMVPASSLYNHDVPEFRAAFAHRPQNFAHPQLWIMRAELELLGLRCNKTLSAFETCVQALDADFDTMNTVDRDRAKVVYRWFHTTLPLTASNELTSWWRQFDMYAFIPTRESTRYRCFPSYSPAALSTPPLFVPPNKILSEKYEPVAWTQRAIPFEPPDKRLLMTYASFGTPTANEVVSNCRIYHHTHLWPEYSFRSNRSSISVHLYSVLRPFIPRTLFFWETY